MKVLILAGGYGSRLSEETDFLPKPMLSIGGKPILWHIMKIYSQYGHNEFIILLGYKGYVIKEYFANYFLHQSDVTIDLLTNEIKVHHNTSDPWKVTLIDTGFNTMTGGRIKRAESYVGKDTFMLTYGDGVTDVNLDNLLTFHKGHGKAVTMTAIQPEGRYGALDIRNDLQINKFLEKPQGDNSWINGGYFVCEPEVFDYIKEGDKTIFERAPLENLAAEGKLYAYKHNGFWQCMDTLRDKNLLNQLWENNEAKWKIWK
jgi:glucose-1-phosphate cytidylyltransferase